MRYDPRFHRKGRASRRGIAVMFALGILSLVIVAVLIFSRRAVTDRQVSSAYASYTGSKDLAMSAFGRAVLQLQKNAALGTVFYSGGVGDNDFDWLWKLDPLRSYLPTDGTCPVRWQYVHDSNGHITGRYAYFVVGADQLKLNAMLDHRFCLTNAVCTGGTGCPYQNRPGNSATELRIEPGRFSGTIAETIDSPTLQSHKDDTGKVAQYESPEQFLTFPFDGKPNGYTLQANKTYEEAMRIVNRWLNISLSSALDEPDAWFGGDLDGNHIKDKNEFFQRFPIRQVNWETITVDDIMKDAVAFYDASGKPNPNNTAGIPWLKNWSDEDAAVGHWTTGVKKARQIAANLINYCASESRAVVSDVSPSSWRVGAPTYTNRPSYTGNKRTWYLNECGIKIQLEVIPGAPVDHSYQVGSETKHWYSFGDKTGSPNKLRINLSVLPEIINMFGSTVLPGTYSVNARMNYEFEYTNMSYTNNTSSYENHTGSFATFTWGRDTGQTLGCSPSTTKTRSTSTAAQIATGYQTFKFTKDSLPDVEYVQRTEDIVGSFACDTIAPSTAFIESLYKVRKIRIYNLHIIVTRENNGSTENVDYAWMPEITLDAEQTISSSSLALEKYLVINDPRHNLNPEDWVISDTGTLGGVNTGVVTCNAGVLDPAKEQGWNQDPETATDANPAHSGGKPTISTAYIRHAPMVTLWELGAIHRAAPWQTLNFKRPKASSLTDAARLAENLKTKGGGAYSEGDFRILDQVTMQGGDKYTPVAQFGRINLNMPGTTSRDFNLHALFRNLPWSTTGKFDLSSSKNLKDTNSVTVKNHLVKYLETAPKKVRLFRRSDIFLTPETATNNFWNLIEKNPYETTEGGELKELTTDTLQEQLICRIIGLTEAYTMPDSATVVVMAQTIQDVGGGAKVYKDWNLNKKFDASSTISTSSTLGKLAGLHAGYYYIKPNDPDTTFRNPGFFTGKIPTSIKDEIEAQYGRYDNGADRITGETLLQARLQYDRVQGKWKIVQVKYEN